MAYDPEFKTKAERVADWRRLYEGKSEAELVHEMHSWIESSEQHIAAKQLLMDIKDGNEQRKHAEVLTETARANKLSKIAIGIAIFAAAVAAAALALQWRDSPAFKPTMPVEAQAGREVQAPSQPVQKAPAPAEISKLPSPNQQPPK